VKYKGSFNSRKDVELYIIKVLKAENEIVDDLLKVFKESADYRIKNEIALFIRKYDNDKIPEAFIEELKKPESKNRDGVIVDCCSYYDCTNYFTFFVDIVLNDETESFLWAIDVIGNMDGPFDPNELNSAISSIQLAIKENINPDKKPHYEKLLGYLLELSDNTNTD
jgi:hypothetical protein